MCLTFSILQERHKVIYDEQKKLAQHQAQTKSQMARYEDELARKRMQACNSQNNFTTLGDSFLLSNSFLLCILFYRLRMSSIEQGIKNL